MFVRFALNGQGLYDLLMPATAVRVPMLVPEGGLLASDALRRLVEAQPALRAEDGLDVVADFRVYRLDADGSTRVLDAHEAATVPAGAAALRLVCLRQPRELLTLYVDETNYVVVVALPAVSADLLVSDDRLRERTLVAATVAAAAAAEANDARGAVSYHLDLQVVAPVRVAGAVVAGAGGGERPALATMPIPPMGPLQRALEVLSAVMDRPPGSTVRLRLRCDFESAPRALEATPVSARVRPLTGMALPDLSDDDTGDEDDRPPAGTALLPAASASLSAVFSSSEPSLADDDQLPSTEAGNAAGATAADNGGSDDVPAAHRMTAAIPMASPAAHHEHVDKGVVSARAATADGGERHDAARPTATSGRVHAPESATVPLQSRSLSFGLDALTAGVSLARLVDDDDGIPDDAAKRPPQRLASQRPSVADATVQRPPLAAPRSSLTGPLGSRTPRALSLGGATGGVTKLAMVRSPAVLRVLLVQGV